MNTSIPGFSLRRAKRTDVALILELIRELSVYEKMADQVMATEEGLESALFDQEGVEVYLAEYEGQTAGYVLFFYNFSTFLGRRGIYIEDIYIRPAMRGKGFGTEIFAFIKKLAAAKACGRVEWTCLDWNEPSIAFYKNMGAKPMDEWTVYRLSME